MYFWMYSEKLFFAPFQDMVMLCVWPEIVLISHWLDGVPFHFENENFLMKNIMSDVVFNVFVNVSRKLKVGIENDIKT